MNTDLIYEDEAYAIRGAIYEVYKSLETGFLEEVYQNALEEELALRHIPFVAKKALKVRYKGRDCGLYEPDFICFDKIIVELKAVETLHERLFRATHELPEGNEFQIGSSRKLLCIP